MSTRGVVALVLLGALASLGSAQAQDPALVPLPWEDAPPLVDDGDWASLRTALGRSLRYYKRLAPERTFAFGEATVEARDLIAGLERVLSALASEPTPEELAETLRGSFELYESSAGDQVLFTGYYEPVIEASLTRQPGYSVPIYGLPKDLVKVDMGAFGRGKGTALGRLDAGRVVPYWTRKQIWEERRLEGRGLELAWAKSWVDAFFVEVQGSGSLLLPDGTLKRFGYAGSNGRPYRSIGRLLIEEGKAPAAKMSMQWIRAYLEANPAEVPRVLGHNESMVFFRWLETEPVGALGQPVTPGRSVATDLRLMPRGALAFLETWRPKRNADGSVGNGPRLRRFVLNQDTGGAIRGPGRVDVFWGRGEDAAETAGMLKHRGRIVFLVPKRARLY